MESGFLSWRRPKVSALPDGGFVVVWASEQNLSTIIFAQRYNSAGSAVGVVMTVAKGAWYSGVGGPDVAVIAGGSFVVTWSDMPTGNTFGQRYTAAGLRTGAPFQINTARGSGDAATKPVGGGFIVVWHGWRSNPVDLCPEIQGIFGQRHDGHGRRVGGEFTVAGRRSPGHQPSLVGLVNGSFVVTWTDDENDIFTNDTGIVRRQYAN
jgi:hypothetical protein